ncbi:hypothetical protein [Streptomyces brasiliscabiei]|uniref:hypothetical protein n=1 Tax=Streptomyces brasiliscabiei TaxID=2736302 RepID=UPI003014FB6A
MLIAIAALGITVFCLTLWSSVTVARMQGIPAWRRYLPLSLFLIAGGASLLRAFGIPEIANAVAFPFNLAAILLSLREIRAQRAKSRVSHPAG